MKIEEFSIFKLTQEVRYSPAYLHWDSVGHIWQEMAKQMPGLEMRRAEPQITSFAWKNQYDLMATLERAHVTGQFGDSGLEEFHSICGNFIDLLKSKLEIREFTRIGLRAQYVKKFESKEAAEKAIDALRLVSFPEGHLFGIESNQTAELFLRREDETMGVVVRIQPHTNSIDVEFPPTFSELDSIHIEHHGLLLDVDYYTRTPVSSDLYEPQAWLKLNEKSIRDGLASILGGSNDSDR